MLLSQYPLLLNPLTKIPSSSSSSSLFPILHRSRPNFLVRSSSLPDSQTLPHSAIQRIADKLRSLGFTEDNPPPPNPPLDDNSTAPGEIFIPLSNQLPASRVGHTLDPSWSTPRKESKEERWTRKREEEEKGKVPTLAELSLGKAELSRLRTLGIKETRKLKVGKAGITEGIVNGIHERWRNEEVVKIVCEDLCKLNMKRTHDLLERKTGGLVVWRSGSKIILYRGVNYKFPYFSSDTISESETSSANGQNELVENEGIDEIGSSSPNLDSVKVSGPSPTNKMVRTPLVKGVGFPSRVRFQLPGEAQLSEEVDRFLEGLGPRFTDWWGCDPVPIDADLLPAVVPGYRKPFRLLPCGVKPKLTDDEMTTLRRLGQPLPCHFVIGRNKKLQGLAASIVKLWEKCEIVKIAVKRGIHNTDSEMMAEELKWLTGGTLLSRDTEFIVLYRGKDFLPSAVSSSIERRRKQGPKTAYHLLNHGASDIIAEVKDETQSCHSGDTLGDINDQRFYLSGQMKLNFTEASIKRTDIALSMELEKKVEAERLQMLPEKADLPQQLDVEKEGITEEERYMLRKVGLKMKPFLLIGRRGVFDGTVENMHLHWKYRELVKVICKERSFEAAHNAASILEAESGGILVGLERVSKGYAIIVYRGKNYRRPTRLRPPALLNKKQAMNHFLEAQRQESLKLNVLRLDRNTNNLKQHLVKGKGAHHRQLSDKSKFQVKRQRKSIALARHVKAETELKPDHYSSAAIAAQCTENIEAGEEHGVDIVPIELNNGPNASSNIVQPSQQFNKSDISSIIDGNETDRSELDSSTGPFIKEIHEIQLAETNGAAVDAASFPDNFLVKAEHHRPSRAGQLSNRERLFLRKQALKMGKRPVIAVGRSNIVTGVAKTIKAHFEKYPLAIVNVKGRAKGTSIQEVVSQLEEATGAVFISQEINKVILYRGWGADLDPRQKYKKNTHDAEEMPEGRVGSVMKAVSSELMAAIRLECGLLDKQEQILSSET